MPLLVLDERHTEELRFLQDLDASVLGEFSKISLTFLREGSNERLYTGAAKQLDVSVDKVRGAVESLAYLFALAARENVSDQDFVDSLLVLGFPPEVNDNLKEQFVDARPELRELEESLQVDLPHLKNMEWRLDVQLATRSMKGQMNPVYVTRWDVETNGKTESTFLQMSYTNLVHVADELELALKELRSTHVRRIARNVR